MGSSVLFAYDGPLYRTETGQYGDLTLNDSLRIRYLHLGESVTFLTRVRPSTLNPKAEQSLIKPERFSVMEVEDFKSIKNWTNRFRALSAIKSAVEKFDIIVARVPSAIGTAAIAHAKKLNKPLMVEVVGCPFDAYWNYSHKTKIIARYKMEVQKRAVSDVPFAIYVTEKFLQKRYPSKAKQINCSNVELGMLDDEIQTRREEKIARTDFEKPLILGTISSLNVPFKAQGDVIKALFELKKERQLNFKYHLVGQGSPERLLKLVSKLDLNEEVRIIGSLKRQEVLRFLDDIDIYIHPSKQEGLPRAVIEAMSRACPVLGSDTAGIPELLKEEDVFKAGDVSGIKNQLRNINRERMQKASNHNFNKAKEFQSDVLEGRRYSFYEEFLKTYDLPMSEKLDNFNKDKQAR